jgi:ankyrin repeat protein
MKRLPASPNLSHLRKQAKELLRSFEQNDPEAVRRVAESRPSARDKDAAQSTARALRLHDAQSCVAREYGFPRWTDLKEYVEMQAAGQASREQVIQQWITLVYGRGYQGPKPALAARLLEDTPDLLGDDPFLACAMGEEPSLRRKLDARPDWVNHPGGALGMTPLIAVTHSGLVRDPRFAEALERCARLLLDRGADPNLCWIDPEFPDGRLSPLYGAAGKNHHPEMTRLLLARGADPTDHGMNPGDSEALYHSVESKDLTCTRLLLDAGARVEGTNTLARSLDYDDPERLRLLLSHCKDLNQHDSHALTHAILRGRSLTQIQMLLDAGANPEAKNRDGITPYRFALLCGRPDVADVLRQGTPPESLSAEDAFVAACARGDAAEARKRLVDNPALLRNLSEKQLQQLPTLAEQGNLSAVKAMVQVGWPIDVQGGDWKASALNLAVYHGNAEMADWLLAHGARWDEKHGFGDNVMGTLSFASRSGNEIEAPSIGDWPGCARALMAHGMPLPPETYTFSEAVAEYFQTLRERQVESAPPLEGNS